MERKNAKNIRELAKILNVSITTVSRVLNGKAESYRISPKTQERVLKAAKEYNYIPNKIARGLKMDKTETLGLIIPDISNPFFADIAKSIEMEARLEGYSIILCDSHESLSLELKLINLLLGHKVEGIIVAPVGTKFDHLERIYESGLPIVIVDRYFPDVNLPFITSDNYHGAFEAVNYLISMGHTKIACVQGIINSQPNKERVSGYVDAMKKNNIEVDYSLITGENFSIENGYKQTHILFSTDEPPTAIFALSNLISLGVIKALSEINISIPGDVSLVSFDEQPYSAYLGTPLTTIEQKKSELGQLAVSVIKRLIENTQTQRKAINMRLKTNLIIRKSVKNLNEFV
ncbi:MAG: LacI family DNA-binding transcriptional regulator [Bacteroidales bacterium]